MTWRQLQTKIENMSECDKDKFVKIWGEEIPLMDAIFCVTTSDLYCVNEEVEESDEFCKEELAGLIKNGKAELVCEKGAPYLFLI